MIKQVFGKVIISTNLVTRHVSTLSSLTCSNSSSNRIGSLLTCQLQRYEGRSYYSTGSNDPTPTATSTFQKLSTITRSKYKISRENNNPNLISQHQQQQQQQQQSNVNSQNNNININNNQNNNSGESNSVHNGNQILQDIGGSRTRFNWEEKPKTVLIIKKHKDKKTTAWLNTMAAWLTETHNLRVLVEPNVQSGELSHIETYSEEESLMLGKVVDFVITLGGDGTLLHVSSLFKEDVPPVISFHLGTLGFLMPFNVEDYQEALTNVIKGDFLCTNRMRLICDVYHKPQIGSNTPSKNFQVLNEVTIHRGSNPHSVRVNCNINGHMLTDIVGDGLIVGTATGSTAYSLSCGGPMVHPCINCILLTPVAPSSLSSKPSLLPDDSILKLTISQKGKSFSTTFDGTRSIKLEQGEYIMVRKSPYPLLTINKTNETTDWVHGSIKLIEMSDKSSIWNQTIHTTSAN